MRPPASFEVKCARKMVRMWTDASGASRMLAAVFFDGSQWFWTRMKVPKSIWDQLLPRGDHQIGFQEFLAFAMGYATFDVSNSLLVSFIDNDGVLRGIIKGSVRPTEVNLAIGKA